MILGRGCVPARHPTSGNARLQNLLSGAGVGRLTLARRSTTAAHRLTGSFALPTWLCRGFSRRFREGRRNAENSGREADITIGLRLRLLRLLLRLRARRGLLLRRIVVLLLRLVLLGLLLLGLVRLMVLVLLRLVLLRLLLVVTLAVISALVATLIIILIAAVIVVGTTLATLIVVLALLVALTVLLLKASIQHTVIVVGMLEIVFGQHAVTGRAGVARHRQEFFHQLLRVATHTAVVAAVEIGIASATTATTAAARTRLAAAVPTTLTVFHIIIVLFVHQNDRTFLKAIPHLIPPGLDISPYGWRGAGATTARFNFGGAHQRYQAAFIGEIHGRFRLVTWPNSGNALGSFALQD